MDKTCRLVCLETSKKMSEEVSEATVNLFIKLTFSLRNIELLPYGVISL